MSRLRVGLWVSVVVCALALAGCGGSEDDSYPSGAQVLPAPTGGPGVGVPQEQTNCTKRASDGDGMRQVLSGAAPGDRICLSGDMSDTRLEVKRSGTPEQPIVILGGGRTTTSGISIAASNVVVDGVAAKQPRAPGMEINGNNITVQNNAVTSPRGGDGDGIRFFGQNLKILHNTISDTEGQDKRHADCMQTFATDEQYGPSQNVLIDGNRCEKIDNICVIAEGPDSEAGDGIGTGNSANFTLSNNFCDNQAGQAFYFDDIENVTISRNEIAGKIDKAFSLQNDSVNAKISDNTINPGIGYEVGMDESSEKGYQGPQPGGGP